MRKIRVTIMIGTLDMVSGVVHFLVTSIIVALGWLGDGIINSLFWSLVLTGSIGAAIPILIVGYTTDRFDVITKKIAHTILPSSNPFRVPDKL